MVDIVRHSLVLVPTAPDVAEQFSAYAKNVFGKCDSQYVCGVHSYPHISVGQFEIEGGGLKAFSRF
jgi:hypothetical protein